MDVSRYHGEHAPIPRNLSSSVPPNVHFQQQISRSPCANGPAPWHRQSLILPTLPEDVITNSEVVEPKSLVQEIYGDSTTHVGWMQKRKNKILRHDWIRNHYRLAGTQLSMHTSALAEDKKALATIDVDDYFVSCSNPGGNSKIAAALKALHISTPGKAPFETPYGFQLVPAADKGKRAMAARDLKTHHFAVAAKEERVDWMREVMLAKAMKQKNEGYSVTVNGQLM